MHIMFIYVHVYVCVYVLHVPASEVTPHFSVTIITVVRSF